MIDSLSIDSDLAMMTSNRKFRYGFSYFLRAMIYTQVVDPGSKLMASERVIPNLYGCESVSYNPSLAAKQRREIMKDVDKAMRTSDTPDTICL